MYKLKLVEVIFKMKKLRIKGVLIKLDLEQGGRLQNAQVMSSELF